MNRLAGSNSPGVRGVGARNQIRNQRVREKHEERRLIRLRVRGLIVRMQPGFGLLPRGRDLGLRHLGG